MKAVVFTHRKDTSWMKACVSFIARIYSAIGDTLTIDIVSTKVAPQIKDGNVDFAWLEQTFDSKGYDTVCYDMTFDDLKASGITDRVAAYNRKPGIKRHIFWTASDHGKRKGMWSNLYPCVEWAYLFLHELLHGLTFFNGLPDTVHYRAANGTMFGLYGEIGLIRKGRQSLLAIALAQLALLTKQLSNMQKALPVPEEKWRQVTQEYCVKDSVNYPRSGVHPGVDFHGVFGDPVYAPVDGEITNSGHSPELGFWVEYFLGADGYLVVLHLRTQPAVGKFKKGEVIANLGATGKIQGVHYHLEGWHRPMDRSLLVNEATVREHTFDIRTLFQ